MADERQGDPKGSPKDSPASGNGARGDRPPSDRLPPPAFPPGQRTAHRRNVQLPGPGGAAGGEPGVPDEAFISPDDPIVRTGSRIAGDAFISPDEPIQQRDPHDIELEEFSPDDVTVTGIGDDAHLGREDQTPSRYDRHDDPFVGEIVVQVGRLADALRERGEAGLKTTPDMTRFEATMRAYCVGYLAAQRDAGRE